MRQQQQQKQQDRKNILTGEKEENVSYYISVNSKPDHQPPQNFTGSKTFTWKTC